MVKKPCSVIPGCQADANVRPMWVLCGSNVFFHGVPWRIRAWAEAEQVGDLLQRGVPWVWWSDGLIGTGRGNDQNMGTVWELTELTMKSWNFSIKKHGISRVNDFSNLFLGTLMGIQWGGWPTIFKPTIYDVGLRSGYVPPICGNLLMEKWWSTITDSGVALFSDKCIRYSLLWNYILHNSTILVYSIIDYIYSLSHVHYTMTLIDPHFGPLSQWG